MQTFTVSEPVWLKYLQFHFITHHGSEPICALNDILVFGKSAAEDLEDQLSDEALAFTEDSHPQQRNTVLDASASADRQHAQVDMLGKPEGLAAGAAEPDLSAEEAANSKHSNAAVEANAGETANKSSAWETSMSGKAASDAIREPHAAEQASAGPHSGQQQSYLHSLCRCELLLGSDMRMSITSFLHRRAWFTTICLVLYANELAV